MEPSNRKQYCHKEENPEKEEKERIQHFSYIGKEFSRFQRKNQGKYKEQETKKKKEKEEEHKPEKKNIIRTLSDKFTDFFKTME